MICTRRTFGALSVNFNKTYLFRQAPSYLKLNRLVSTSLICSSETENKRCFANMTEPKVTPLKLSKDLVAADFDGVVVVGPSIKDLGVEHVRASLQPVAEVDNGAEKGVFVVAGQKVKRIVFSGTGPLDKDYDDVRR